MAQIVSIKGKAIDGTTKKQRDDDLDCHGLT